MEHRKIQKYQLPCKFELSAPSKEAENEVLVHIVARTGYPVEFMGEMQIHDFSGMHTRERIVFNLHHDEWNLIGYADEITLTENGLEMTGHIFRDMPRGAGVEAITILKNGVPQQASIEFRETRYELVEAGDEREVNGGTVTGPVTIHREWVLEGIALCSTGVDGNTAITPENFERVKTMKKKKYEDTSCGAPADEEKKETMEGEETPETKEGMEGEPETVDDDPLAKLTAIVEALIARVEALEGGNMEGEDTPKKEEMEGETDEETKEEMEGEETPEQKEDMEAEIKKMKRKIDRLYSLAMGGGAVKRPSAPAKPLPPAEIARRCELERLKKFSR